MPASYPSSVKTFTKKRDLLDIVLAADINLVYDEVTAIETILGTNPATNAGWTSGAFSTSTLNWPSVRARLQNIEYGLYDAHIDRVKSSGGSIITTTDNAVVSLTVTAKSGQTADLFQAKNSGGTTVTKINSTGALLVNGLPVATTTGVETLSSKTISGANNTLLNIPTSAVVVSGSTDIQEYVEARPTVYYQPTAPTGVIAGTVWVDSSENVDPFDASALILSTTPSPSTSVAGYRRIFTNTAAPTSSDGADGDIWLQFI